MANRKPFSLTEEPMQNEVAFKSLGLMPKDEEIIKEIPIELLESHKDNKYSVVDNQKMAELAESIREFGVLEPLLVAPTENGFTILAGHRRKFAAEKAGLSTVPCIIRDANDDEQNSILVDTNNQREQTISEKAWGYRLKYDAERRKSGHRSDLEGEESQSTIEKLSCGNDESKSQIARLIRITKLRPDILFYVDGGVIPLHAAERLSSLSDPGQEIVADYMSDGEKKKISIEQAEFIRDADKEGVLTYAWLVELMGNGKKKVSSDPEEEKRLKKIEKFNKVTKDCFPKDADKYVAFDEREDLVKKLVNEWMDSKRSEGEEINED